MPPTRRRHPTPQQRPFRALAFLRNGIRAPRTLFCQIATLSNGRGVSVERQFSFASQVLLGGAAYDFNIGVQDISQ